MKLRSLLAGTAFSIISIFGGSAAFADPIATDLSGVSGPITIKFSNYESFSSATLAPGVTNFGVVNVTSIN